MQTVKDAPSGHITAQAKILSDECKRLEKRTRVLLNHPAFQSIKAMDHPGHYDEMKAQIMLAIRHLEDARMRLGDVLPYAGVGVNSPHKSRAYDER